MEEALAELENALGRRFSAPGLLVRALTHRSLAREQEAHEHQQEADAGAATADGHAPIGPPVIGDNERLEFLGDAVLGLVVAESLFSLHPEWHEGELTRVRAQLVSRQHLGQVAQSIGLGRYLLLSRGEDKSGLRRKGTVLSNTIEAVIGALFLDGGLEPVRAFAQRWVMGQAAEQLAEELRSGAALGNYKSALQERLQAERAGTPVYRLKRESGPGHRKRFLVEVRLKMENGAGKPLARGMGSTKKHAEQDAARRALERLAGVKAADIDPAEDIVEEEEAAQ